jgi:toxin YoeB
MICKVLISNKVDSVIKKYKKSNSTLFKKFDKLYKEIELHQRTGIGHPEPLIKGKDARCSPHRSRQNNL